MKRATNNKKIIIDNGRFIGITLGYDFTPEHEGGIEKLRRIFKVNDSDVGVERYNTKNGDAVVMAIHDNGKLAILKTKTTSYWQDVYSKIGVQKSFKEMLNSEINISSTTMFEKEAVFSQVFLETAWSDSDFGIITHVEYIKELYDAFKRNDIVITSVKHSNNCLNGTSLTLCIASRLSQDDKQKFLN
jgi:hypothetical protein